MIHKDVQKGAGVEGTTFEDYWYDGANRLTYAQNDYSTVTRKYNSYNEVYEETSAITINGATQTKTVQSEFDILGNRTGLTYPSGKQISFDRDALDRVKYVLDGGNVETGLQSVSGNAIAEYQYKGYRVKTRKSGNGTQLDIAYDAMRRITQYQNNFVGTGQGPVLGVANFEYGYNKEGMRTYEQYTPGAGETNQQARGKVFTYDSLYQITGVKYDVPYPIAELQNPGSQTFTKQVTYQFDNSGNREGVTTAPFGQTPQAQTYQANSLNQYTTIDTSLFGYDQVGNMTQGVIYLDDQANPGQKTPVLARFIYDYNNELLRVERQNDSAVLGEYAYDCLGRRIWKNARNSLTPQPFNSQTYFWYNGAECIEETDVNGAVIASYVFGIGIDEAISVEFPQTSGQYPQSGTYWYHTDVLGSVVAITNQNGEVIERYNYDIYGEATVLAPDGETIRSESVLGNRILYTGREYDRETGLYYYRARYYHAQMGRFISLDPAGSGILGNLFGYTANNSINFIDPFGLDVIMSSEQFNQIKKDLPAPLLTSLEIAAAGRTVTAYDLYDVVITENVRIGTKSAEDAVRLQIYIQWILQRVEDETCDKKVAALKQFLFAVIADEDSQYGSLDLSQAGMPDSKKVSNDAQKIWERDRQLASQPAFEKQSPFASSNEEEVAVSDIVAAGAYAGANTVLPLDETAEAYGYYEQGDYVYTTIYGGAALIQIIPFLKWGGKALKWLWKVGKRGDQAINIVKNTEKVATMTKDGKQIINSTVGAMGRRTRSLSDAASNLKISAKEMGQRIEKLKQTSGLGRIPEVEIDVVSGEVFVKDSAESIGNIWDVFIK